MATNRSQPVIANQDYGNTQRINNLPNAVDAQQPVTKAQMEAANLLKQDVVTGGAGITVNSSVLAVDLATAGSDYTALNVTDAAFTSLEGEYQRLGYQAYLDYAGTNLDLNFGGDFNGYYKDNGGGVWAVIFRREIDGDAGTSDLGSWLAVLTTVDPTTVSGNVSSYIPNYQAVDYDSIAGADVIAENTFRSPAPGGYGLNSDMEYAIGATPAGLKFENNKLALDFASQISDASSTKVFPSSVVKTYIDEQVSDAKDLSNHPFNNTVAQISGNPTNAQSAFEALEAEIDSVESSISSIQTVNTTQTSQITAAAQAVGIALGESNLGDMTSTWITDNTSVKSVLNQITIEMDARAVSSQALLGVSLGDTGMGDMVSPIYTDDTTVKALLEEAGAAIESLQVGAGAFWTAVDYHHHEDIDALPVGWGDGSTDVGTFVVDPSGSNIDIASMGTGTRILVVGDGTDPITGIYVVNADNSVSRSADANDSTDFTTNKTVNIINGGSHAGATYAYVGSDNPTLDTDPLEFQFKQGTNLGDGTVTEAKLTSALANKVNDKTDKYVETVTTDASGYVTITHTLGSADFIAQAWTVGGTPEVLPTAEFSDPDINSVILGGAPSTQYKVILIG